jgi:hypothetical protein
MFSFAELLLFTFGGAIWWLGVYVLSRNVRSSVARLIFAFLLCLSVYFTGDLISRGIIDYKTNSQIWRWITSSYIFPIALIFHFSVVTTGSQKDPVNRLLILPAYLVAICYLLISITTDLFINYQALVKYIPGVGYVNARGPLFWTLAIYIGISLLGATRNYVKKQQQSGAAQRKYKLAILSSLLYLIVGPITVGLYYLPNQLVTVQLTPYLIILPFIPLFISIFFYKLVSDVDSVFSIREFAYLSGAMFLINLINGLIFLSFAPLLGESARYLVAIFMFITIFTHGFYDWLTTFIRDLLYNAGRGFSLITDQEVTDLVRNFYNPEKLETNSLLKFTAVKSRATDKKLVDSAHHLTREAIGYFQQPDFPRRTKQNLKYQLLKMATLDEAEEGQILWELGFDGYPMKIMSGESTTRKPLFKIESMSDYTATSRNAFIALKKEAIHDLAWRLSYLERISK